ncbi:MAG TPA: branched-chain amino acid ABC transporter permease [Acidimicrobiaceae bacterium]|mgnify:CR=1 FL=1|nr:branched-chain amino acid ABC transporter permease [Acidimicrobiaceae bacterium]
MTKLLQTLVDGLGVGSTYALLALGISLIFGVMHLVNFAHGELITVGAYTSYFFFIHGGSWWWMPVAILASAALASVFTELVAFRWVRNASPFTLLLTSFAIERLSHALWQIFISPKQRTFRKPSWVFNQFSLGSVRFEVMDLVTIGVTGVTLVITAVVFKRTLFGVAVRGAAEDFDAARLMGVKANRVISGAFAFAGLLAGVAACLILMRTPAAEPAMGADWLLKAVIAAVIGGLGSFTGAVVGGLVLGLLETFTRAYLPDVADGWDRFSTAVVFILIAAFFVVRPDGVFKVSHAERV